MFSTLDALMECPMDSLLEGLPLTAAIKDALTDGANRGNNLGACVISRRIPDAFVFGPAMGGFIESEVFKVKPDSCWYLDKHVL